MRTHHVMRPACFAVMALLLLSLALASGTLPEGPTATAHGVTDGGGAVAHAHTSVAAFTPTGMRTLPVGSLYGVTDDGDGTATTAQIVAGVSAFQTQDGSLPITRLYLDPTQPASSYANEIAALQPHSYLMAELLDSSDEKSVSVARYQQIVATYLADYGDHVDLWEIGNEVNGNWTGPYSTVATKLTNAYTQVAAAGKRTALTLYENSWGSNHCGDGAKELTPQQFSSQDVPASVRDGLTYVFLSWYPTQCTTLPAGPSKSDNLDVPVSVVAAEVQALHTLYPNALIGFGELGYPHPVTSKNTTQAEGVIAYYSGLSAALGLPYYVGGSFWWYFDEDALPYSAQHPKPLWSALNASFETF